MKVKDLKPAGYNPRKISKEKLAALKKSLEEFGDLSGIVVNARKDKYFAVKTPDAARINGRLFRITRITETPTEWRVYLGGAA